MKFDRGAYPYPNTWHKFQARTANGLMAFNVQDLTEDLFEESVNLLLEHFTKDEPPCKHIEVNKYPAALAELERLWRKTLSDQISLVCVVDDDTKRDRPVIVGLNVLTVVHKDDKDEPFETTNKIWAKLFGAVDLVTKGVDIFLHYKVDKYLTAYGLIVVPEFRGCNIGKEILRARIPLCKALNIKVTATVFTAVASQVLATKAGFETLYEIDYEDLAKKGFIFPGIEQSTKSSKLMALVVPPECP